MLVLVVAPPPAVIVLEPFSIIPEKKKTENSEPKKCFRRTHRRVKPSEIKVLPSDLVFY